MTTPAPSVVWPPRVTPPPPAAQSPRSTGGVETRHGPGPVLRSAQPRDHLTFIHHTVINLLIHANKTEHIAVVTVHKNMSLLSIINSIFYKQQLQFYFCL